MRNIRHTAKMDICRIQKHQRHQRSIKHQLRKEAAVEGNQLSGSEMKDVGSDHAPITWLIMHRSRN